MARRLHSHVSGRPEDCFFSGTHAGAEIDLVVMRGNRREGFEVKLTTSAKITQSMRQAQETLELDRLVVVHAGDKSFPLAAGVEAVAASRIWDLPSER